MTNEKLGGVVVPMVTPMRADHAVCEESVRRLIGSFAGEASAILPALSSGEGKNLSERQWRDIVVYSVRHRQGLKVYPGAMVKSDEELFKRARIAADAGADGITVVVPSWSQGAQEVVEYFARLEKSLPLPIFIYHEQADGDAASIAEALTAICRLSRVVAIKESSHQPAIASRLARANVPSAVFQGWEDLCFQTPGADGNAMALSNLEAGLCAEMFREPTEVKQQSIDAMCRQYGLFDDAWYAALKNILWKRGILSTNTTA